MVWLAAFKRCPNERQHLQRSQEQEVYSATAVLSSNDFDRRINFGGFTGRRSSFCAYRGIVGSANASTGTEELNTRDRK